VFSSSWIIGEKSRWWCSSVGSQSAGFPHVEATTAVNVGSQQETKPPLHLWIEGDLLGSVPKSSKDLVGLCKSIDLWKWNKDLAIYVLIYLVIRTIVIKARSKIVWKSCNSWKGSEWSIIVCIAINISTIFAVAVQIRKPTVLIKFPINKFI